MLPLPLTVAALPPVSVIVLLLAVRLPFIAIFPPLIKPKFKFFGNANVLPTVIKPEVLEPILIPEIPSKLDVKDVKYEVEIGKVPVPPSIPIVVPIVRGAIATEPVDLIFDDPSVIKLSLLKRMSALELLLITLSAPI